MSSPARTALYAFLAGCVIFGARHALPAPVAGGGGVGSEGAAGTNGGAQYRMGRGSAERAHVALLSTKQRAGTFRFAPATSRGDQDIFLAAVASARPEARRLVALVDGLVTVYFEHPPGSAIGLTHFDGTDYDVTVDLASVIARFGAREANAIVLHELGHVVDIALVPDELQRELDLGIPVGESCTRDGPPVGACAPIHERFADSFSKWAMDDLGVNLASGYRILPPVPLEAWGRPLVGLGA